MYGVRVEGEFTALTDVIANMQRLADDLPELGEIVAADMLEGNEQGLLAGLDRDGEPMPPTKREMTPSIAARLGNGKPLNPKGGSSRSIADFSVRVIPISAQALAVDGTWPTAPFFVYHREGRVKGAPIRDIVGIRPLTMDVIMRHTREWAERKLRGS